MMPDLLHFSCLQSCARPAEDHTPIAPPREGSSSKEGQKRCRLSGKPCRLCSLQTAATAVGHCGHTQTPRCIQIPEPSHECTTLSCRAVSCNSKCQSVMQICLSAALTAWRSVYRDKQIQSKRPGHRNSLPLLSNCKLQHILYNIVISSQSTACM